MRGHLFMYIAFSLLVLIDVVKIPAPCSHTSQGHIEVIRALVAQGGPSILDLQDADGQAAYLHVAFSLRAPH